MVITRSGRLSFPEQPVTAAAAPVAVEAIVPLVQAPGNEAPIPILPIVQAPMAPPIQAPAIPVPGAAAQVVGAQATVDDQVQGEFSRSEWASQTHTSSSHCLTPHLFFLSTRWSSFKRNYRISQSFSYHYHWFQGQVSLWKKFSWYGRFS